MAETWTAPQTGWYRIGTGEQPEFLGTERPENLTADELLRVENDGREVRLLQNSGSAVSVGSMLTVPSGAWVTVPWDER